MPPKDEMPLVKDRKGGGRLVLRVNMTDGKMAYCKEDSDQGVSWRDATEKDVAAALAPPAPAEEAKAEAAPKKPKTKKANGRKKKTDAKKDV